MSDASNRDKTSELFNPWMRLDAIFSPYAREQREKFYTCEGKIKHFARFAHYTTAEAALKIIESKRVWMRNATCMADYREVQHGLEMLQRFFADPTKRKPFYDALNAISNSLAEEAVTLFNQ